METKKLKRGRPSVYTPGIATEVCDRLAAGEPLKAICRDEHMPAESVVRQWALDDREGFSARYTRARQLQVELYADEIIEISDDSTGDSVIDPETGAARVNQENIQRAKLRVDTRKWLLSKLIPKKYGDKLELAAEDSKALTFTVVEMPYIRPEKPED